MTLDILKSRTPNQLFSGLERLCYDCMAEGTVNYRGQKLQVSIFKYNAGIDREKGYLKKPPSGDSICEILNVVVWDDTRKEEKYCISVRRWDEKISIDAKFKGSDYDPDEFVNRVIFDYQPLDEDEPKKIRDVMLQSIRSL